MTLTKLILGVLLRNKDWNNDGAQEITLAQLPHWPFCLPLTFLRRLGLGVGALGVMAPPENGAEPVCSIRWETIGSKYPNRLVMFCWGTVGYRW